MTPEQVAEATDILERLREIKRLLSSEMVADYTSDTIMIRAEQKSHPGSNPSQERLYLSPRARLAAYTVQMNELRHREGQLRRRAAQIGLKLKDRA